MKKNIVLKEEHMGLGPSVCWFGAMAPACPSFLLFLLF